MPSVKAYYNEHDAYCAQWLRNLISAGHIPDGDVDERSITEVKANEIKEYDQWHFFAGLGGWGYAARLAGIGETSGVLTGSPPCQPFSNAGKRQGYADERHLAPVWLDLVAALRPAWVFGEQVAAAIRKDDWLDDLLNALETEGYTTGASVLPACSVGAPHIRQRLWVVARLGNAKRGRPEGWNQPEGRSKATWKGQRNGGVADTKRQQTHQEQQRPAETKRERSADSFSGRVLDSGLADTEDRNGRAGQHNDETERQQGDGQPSGHHRDRGLADADGSGRQQEQSSQPTGIQRKKYSKAKQRQKSCDNGASIGGLADPTITGRETFSGDRIRNARAASETPAVAHNSGYGRGSANQAGWDDPDWLYCRDGKWRPVESGTFPLANGIPARVGRLRAYGNAIVPQVAAKVITEAMSTFALHSHE